MRVFEIDDDDIIGAALAEINLEIDDDYETAKVGAAILRNTNNPVLQKVWIDALNNIASNLERILTREFADDESTRILKHKAKQMLDNIRKFTDKF